MKKIIDLSLVLACYNEERIFDESSKCIIDTLRNSPYSFEIIFVDDKSRDSTPMHIRNICRKYKECTAIYHPKNYGRGKSVKDGLLKAHGIVAGYMDIDCEVSPVYIPEIVKVIINGESDVVIGKRIYRTSLRSLMRELFSIGYKLLSTAFLHTGNLDTETGYKFFKRKAILPVITKTCHPHWFWDTEIIVYAIREGLRIREVPVLFIRRFDKKSTVKPVRDIFDYLVNIFKLRKRMKSFIKKKSLGLASVSL